MDDPALTGKTLGHQKHKYGMFLYPFPVARYRFDCQVVSPIRLPEYAGSTLRGALGHALKKTACMTRQSDCKTCPLYRSCPYPAIFAPPPPETHSLQKFSEIPAPFIVEPPAWGERHYGKDDILSFEFILIGRALAQLPLIVYAWQRALATGIAKGDGTAKLVRVSLIETHAETTIYSQEEGQIKPHTAEVISARSENQQADTQHISLQIETPLRIQHNGHPKHPNELTSRDLLITLLRRIALISEFHVGQKLELDFQELGEAATHITSDKQLTWRDWTRYSNRQKQEMTLGGVMGGWQLKGNLKPFVPILELGQWLHIGKNASFGLGRYRLIDEQSRN
jgi:hypothetical protein